MSYDLKFKNDEWLAYEIQVLFLTWPLRDTFQLSLVVESHIMLLFQL